MPDTPNVVIVHTDDTGQYIGPYGHDIETPNLQQLADDGVLFRNAHCSGPTCSPSRGALLSGSSPHSNGLIGLAHRGFSMADYEQHLANYLSDRGYEAVLAGQQHEIAEDAVEGSAARTLGYDRVLEGDRSAVRSLPIDHDPTRRDLANTQAAVDYIRGTAEEPTSPFFLSVGLHNTHQPMPLDQEEIDPGHVSPPEPLPDVQPVREEMAAYHVLAQYVDECVGEVIEALDAVDELDNTVLLFTTDHGIPFPLMKCDLYDGGIQVSLIARFPEGTDIPSGVTEDSLVSQIDLFPTLSDLLDTEIPEWVEGNSLLPLLRGEVESVRDEVFSEVTYHAAYEPKRCVRTERYKYIRRFDDEYDQYVAPNTDNGPTKRFFIDLGLYDRETPQEELYDLHLDPSERNNLIGDASYEGVHQDLQDRLDEWMTRTDDPLLDGPVSKPDGAVADSRDALHPDTGSFEQPDIR